MDDQIIWLLRGASVTAANDADLLMPHGNHRLLIKRALDLLSNDASHELPAVLSVHNLPWSVKSIVEANSGREPIWAVHTQLRTSSPNDYGQNLSPFVCASRDIRPSMTRSLTCHITGTLDRPVIARVYPGNPLPPLPWQIDERLDIVAYEASQAFWRQHSFIYDKAIARHQQNVAPSWVTNPPSPQPLHIH